MSNKNVIVYGGTFNPPTLAHQFLAIQVLKLFEDAKVLVIPTNDSYPKPDKVPAQTRYNMLQKVFKDYPSIIVSDIEVQQKDVYYTVDTLKEVRCRYPNAIIYLMIGDDNLKDILKWKSSEILLSEYKLLVLNRNYNACKMIEETALLQMYKRNITILDDVLPVDIRGISSTAARSYALKNSEKLKDYVPDVIHEMVYQLYGKNEE